MEIKRKFDLGGVFKKNSLKLQDFIDDIKNNPKIRDAGAIFSFTGTVRNSSFHSEKAVKQMEIEVWGEKAVVVKIKNL